MSFSELELAFLASQTPGRLTTVQPDGTLQVNPVGFTYNAELDTFDINGYRLSTSRKFHNIADNGRAAFVIHDVPSVDPWRVRCLEIRGQAQAITSTGQDPGQPRRRPHPHPSHTHHQLRDRHPRPGTAHHDPPQPRRPPQGGDRPGLALARRTPRHSHRPAKSRRLTGLLGRKNPRPASPDGTLSERTRPLQRDSPASRR